MKKGLIPFGLILGLILSTQACIDEKYTTDPTKMLSFSTDTLSFDTVFNTIASRTRSFLVLNPNKQALQISSIKIENGKHSYFRINVDGEIPENNTVQNVSIKGNDSLYMFVELTIKEQGQNDPILIRDAVIFETNGVQQRVQLTAYGQDAIILKGKTVSENTTLSSKKPYLIFDYLHVAKGVTLTLIPGTRLFFHNAANFIVDGNLSALGTFEKPIFMRGDRFDNMPDMNKTPYAYMSGQWGSLYLQSHNGVHTLDHTNISGGTNGIIVTGNTNSSPTLTLKNSKIHMMDTYGLFAKNAKIDLSNTEISNCGSSCLYIIGGENSINHCTIANYYEQKTRKDAAVIISNYSTEGNWMYLYPLHSAVFQNSILFGNLKQELSLDKDTFSNQNNAFNIYFSHCHIKATKQTGAEFKNNVWSKNVNKDASGKTYPDTVFMNTSISDKTNGYYDFSLKPTAASRNSANKNVAAGFPTDKENYNRLSDGNPDMGAYEWHKK